jgi:hypothetical protein
MILSHELIAGFWELYMRTKKRMMERDGGAYGRSEVEFLSIPIFAGLGGEVEAGGGHEGW